MYVGQTVRYIIIDALLLQGVCECIQEILDPNQSFYQKHGFPEVIDSNYCSCVILISIVFIVSGWSVDGFDCLGQH